MSISNSLSSLFYHDSPSHPRPPSSIWQWIRNFSRRKRRRCAFGQDNSDFMSFRVSLPPVLWIIISWSRLAIINHAADFVAFAKTSDKVCCRWNVLIPRSSATLCKTKKKDREFFDETENTETLLLLVANPHLQRWEKSFYFLQNGISSVTTIIAVQDIIWRAGEKKSLALTTWTRLELERRIFSAAVFHLESVVAVLLWKWWWFSIHLCFAFIRYSMIGLDGLFCHAKMLDF